MMPGRQFDEQRVFTSELRVLEAAGRTFTGLAAPFDRWTPINGSYLERLVEDTFAESVTRGQGRNAPLLLSHNRSEPPIGKPVAWETTDDGLVGTWEVDVDSERGGEAWRLISDGFIRGLSVGFTSSADDDIDLDGDVPRITRRNNALREVSLVSVPAYEDAQITMVRTRGLTRGPDPRIAAYRRLVPSL